MIAMTAQQTLSTIYKVLQRVECIGPYLMVIEWFMLGFQKSIKAVAALISAGIVTAMEYQKFQLDIWYEYYHQHLNRN
jgi:hypothetical protein